MTTTLTQFWFNFILLNLCIILGFRNARKEETRNVSWWLMLVFCLFAFWDIDYFGLYLSFKDMAVFGGDFRDLLYPWLAKISFGNYTLFRFYIWGIAVFLLYQATKLLGLSRNLTIYVMIMNFMLLFSYARASLGMCLYFYGLTYFAVSERRGKLWVMLLCFIFAFFSHRSMLILIALTPLFFFSLNSRRLVLSFIAFAVILIPLSRFVMGNMASMDIEETGDMLDSLYASAANYSTLITFDENNWKFELIIQLRNLSVFVGTAVCGIIVLRQSQFVSPYMKRLIMLVIGIVLTGSAFLLHDTFGSWIVGYRILYMAGIPVVLLLSYLVENGYCSWKALHWVFLPSLLFQEGFLLGKIISLS